MNRPTDKQNRQQRAVTARAAQRELAVRRAAQQKRARTIRIGAMAFGLVCLAAVATIVAVIASGSGSRHPQNTSPPRDAGSVPTWPAPAAQQVPALVSSAGLSMLEMEGSDLHFHVHLDVLDKGTPIAVPAGIGIAGQTSLSPLHTHDASGIIHIESPTQRTFSLGQLFAEWNVPMSTTCVGTLCATQSTPLTIYVNGTAWSGDPRQIQLTAHQEIAIVYGTLPSGTTPPASYNFPAGL